MERIHLINKYYASYRRAPTDLDRELIRKVLLNEIDEFRKVAPSDVLDSWDPFLQEREDFINEGSYELSIYQPTTLSDLNFELLLNFCRQKFLITNKLNHLHKETDLALLKNDKTLFKRKVRAIHQLETKLNAIPLRHDSYPLKKRG